MKVYWNQEGVDHLNKLADDLGSINVEISAAGSSLRSTISAEEANLGIYASEIMGLVDVIDGQLKASSEVVDFLVSEIRNLATEMADMIGGAL